MLTVEGVIQVLPTSVSYDTGDLRAEGKTEPAIILSFSAPNGTVQIILPAGSTDQIIEGMKEIQKKVNQKSSDLYVPPSAEEGIQQAEILKKTHDEITTPDG